MKKRLVKLIILASIILITGCSKESPGENKGSAEGKIRIGISQFMDHESLDKAREGFIDTLEASDLNVEIVIENQNGDMSLTNTSAQSLNNKDLDLVYAIATPSAQGIKNVIQDIPVIFSAVTDPLGAGLVDNLDSPGANITGVSDYINPEEQLDEFLEIFPDTKTFGVIYSTSEQNSEVQLVELEKALEERNLKLESVGISNINDISQAVTSISGKIDALFALTDNTVASGAPVVAKILIENGLPSLSAEEGQVENGLLMSQGVNYYKHGEQAGEMAIRILKGQEIKDTPVEYNKVNEKRINEETAKALGIEINK